MKDMVKCNHKNGGMFMGAIAMLFMYALIGGIISVVAYLVIKLAVKAALKEYTEEKQNEKN